MAAAVTSLDVSLLAGAAEEAMDARTLQFLTASALQRVKEEVACKTADRCWTSPCGWP